MKADGVAWGTIGVFAFALSAGDFALAGLFALGLFALGLFAVLLALGLFTLELFAPGLLEVGLFAAVGLVALPACCEVNGDMTLVMSEEVLDGVCAPSSFACWFDSRRSRRHCSKKALAAADIAPC